MMYCHILFKQQDLHTIHEHVTPFHDCNIFLKISKRLCTNNLFQEGCFWYGRILFIQRKNSPKKTKQGNKIQQHKQQQKIYNYVQL